MAINNDMLGKIKKLDDAQFKSLISEIASAAGADPLKTAALLRDTGTLREILNDMTPDEAQNLINKVGKDKAESILKNIEGKI